ncbi:hypothetical protein [Jejuia pallidilutea]|uniref:hypothetical protein n=1 Tax=Jejuia pallidilutea TaxID=504487 RepID=UPI00187C075F|nr:hypothetical protein [Jejuia pallidilutea]
MKRVIYIFSLNLLLLACSSPSTIDPDPDTLDPEAPSQIERLTVNLQFLTRTVCVI